MSNNETGFIKFLMLLLVLGLMSGLTACHKNNSQSFSQTKAESIIGGTAVDASSKFASRVLYLALGVVKKTTPNGFTISQKGQCTASAISTKILLTAAHCVADLQPSEVNAVLSLNPWNHELNANEWIDVETIKIHDNYVSTENAIENDIALIKLKTEIPSERVSKIAVDSQTTSQLKLTAIGYGLTSPLLNPTDETSNTQKNTLLFYVQKNVSNYDPQAPYFQVDQSDMKGICSGDSGGPGFIFDKSTNDFYILGVTSFVSIYQSEQDKKDPNHIYNECIGSGNYTNILIHREWITKTIPGLL